MKNFINKIAGDLPAIIMHFAAVAQLAMGIFALYKGETVGVIAAVVSFIFGEFMASYLADAIPEMYYKEECDD